jgi:hypothetical protein
VWTLGEGGGSRRASAGELNRLREFFARQVLRAEVDDYILKKYCKHVLDDLHWPDDTSPGDYLESLRTTVLDPRSAIYLTADNEAGDWTIYFVGRVRRDWRGPDGSDRIAVLFNGERCLFITGFQPAMGDAYIERQGGFWLQRI